MKSDGAKFNMLFHGLLDRGIYIAPALYEAGFVSAAHTDAIWPKPSVRRARCSRCFGSAPGGGAAAFF